MKETGEIIPKEVKATQSISYKPTGLSQIDDVLNRIDHLTHGKAGTLQHVTTYLFSGGLAAIVNLTTLFVVYTVVVLPIDNQLHFVFAYFVAEELSILINFSINDRVTFTHLPGHARHWQHRLVRFHITCFTGIIVTFGLSYSLHFFVGLPVILAQSLAILISLAVNFTMHHLWTYRKIG